MPDNPSFFAFQDGKVSLAELMEFLRADPHQATPTAAGESAERWSMRASHTDSTPCMLARAVLSAVLFVWWLARFTALV